MNQAIDGELGSNLRIDRARLWDSLMRMAQIGPGLRGGNNRLALSDADREARLLFQRWAEDAGCTVIVDSMGNMFARRSGEEDGLAPVVVGSHLDTQPTGGRFDGVLGVLAGLEMARTLNDLGIATRHPIEIVNWTNEEGSRFAPAMISSGVFAGAFSEDFALGIRDAAGASLGEELERIGFRGSEPVGKRPIHAYFELHIEQGPILEAEGHQIGVVTHAQGQRWFDLLLTGFESHAGTTPMARRRDALVAASRLVLDVDRIAREHGPKGVGTVGMLSPYPASRNVIPGSVEMTVDFRHPDDEALSKMKAEFLAALSALEAAGDIHGEAEEIFYYPPLAFDAHCVDAVRRAAARLGYGHCDIVSGAGHDACYIARVAPSAMIFCPCVDGISHNEAEAITPEWAAAGAEVLMHAALEAAGMR